LFPFLANNAARLAAKVVFPVPPLYEWNVITCFKLY